MRFYQGVRVAALLNRTLVLPRFRCGEAAMAYPCYAWYHRHAAPQPSAVADEHAPCAACPRARSRPAAARQPPCFVS